VRSIGRRGRGRSRTHEALKSLLEVALDATMAVSWNGRIIELNARAQDLFGYRRDELVGKAMEVLVPVSGRAAHSARFIACLTHQRPAGTRTEMVVLRKDGTEFPADIALSAADVGQDFIVFAAVRDLSAQPGSGDAKVKGEAEPSARLDERSGSLDRFSADIARDLDAVLTAVADWVPMVVEAMGRAGRAGEVERWETVRRDVERVHRAADACAQLTGRVLDLGRHEFLSSSPGPPAPQIDPPDD